MTEKRALYIGRFQPFHNGHLDALYQIQEQGFSSLCIVIGSAQESDTQKNPLSASERFEMIKEIISHPDFRNMDIVIVPVPDIENNALWPSWVLQIIPSVDTLFTGSSFIAALWKRYATHDVQMLQKRKNICATQIRELIKKEQDISTHVPAITLKKSKDYHLAQRLQAQQ